MGTYILTSLFPNGMGEQLADVLRELIVKREHFAFIASDFRKEAQEETDHHAQGIGSLLESIGIRFEWYSIIDARMSPEQARKEVEHADVVWLAGGDTPTEYAAMKEYGLCEVLQQHTGVIIGMSAGSINMGREAVCTLTCGHDRQQVYPALGLVEWSVEPHFHPDGPLEELLELSKSYCIYGLCDEGAILRVDGAYRFYGEIYRMQDGKIEPVNSLPVSENLSL